MNKINQQFAQEFDDKCRKWNSHGFLRYATEPDFYGCSLIDLIAQVEDQLKPTKVNPERKINLTENELTTHIINFFSTYMPKKAEEVKQICNKTHPLFIDADGKSHISFHKVGTSDHRSSSVGHPGENSFLSFDVFLHGDIDDLRVAAHEMSHALSSRNQHIVKDIRMGKKINMKVDWDFDGATEIESLITEKLFNRYLVKSGLYSKEDVNNYENAEINSLITEICLIRQETDVLKNLPCPVTQESLNALVKNLEKEHNTRLLHRIEAMHDDHKSSPYMFRYIVGRIISDQWAKRFDGSDKETQETMLDNFQDYLTNAHGMTYDQTCDKLLGNSFQEVAENYCLDKINDRKKENITTR